MSTALHPGGTERPRIEALLPGLAAAALLLAGCSVDVLVGPGGGSSAGAGGSGPVSSSRSASSVSAGSSSTGSTGGAGTSGQGGASTSGQGGASTSGQGGAGAATASSTASTGGSPGQGGAGGGVVVGGTLRLVGAHWTGSAEAVDRIDPATGAGAFLGDLGSLHGWSDQLVLNGDATRVYAAGGDVSNVAKLFVLDLETGTSTEVAVAHPGYFLAGVADDGRAIGVYWNGAAEAVDLVDPVTGLATTVGVLGDLHSWAGQLTYDHAAHVVYAIGRTAASPSDLHLYSLALDTQQSGSAPCSFDYVLGGILPNGSLLGAYWDGDVERVDEIDPATCAAAAEGQLGDLHWWSDSFTYDPTTNVAHAVGTTVDQSMVRVYSLDLDTLASTEVAPTVSGYVLARP